MMAKQINIKNEDNKLFRIHSIHIFLSLESQITKRQPTRK